MKKSVLITIIVSSVVALVVIFLVIFGIVNNASNTPVTHTYDLTNEPFINIDIDLTTAELEFYKSSDNTCKVVCQESTKDLHEVKVENNTLTIKNNSYTRKWYEKILIFDVNQKKISVYLPQDNCGNLVVDSATGRVAIPQGFTFNSASISVSTGSILYQANTLYELSLYASTGSIEAKDIKAATLKAKSSTGSISLTNIEVIGTLFNVKASTGSIRLENVKGERLVAETSTGSIKISNALINSSIDINSSTGSISLLDSDAASIYIESTTGGVTGTLLSPKTFKVNTTTGSINVPQGTSGGLCEIKTTTGSISMSIKEQ